MSLKHKLWACFVGLIIVPLLILGVISFRYMSTQTEHDYANSTELTLKALLLSVDQVFEDMNKMTDSTIANRAIQEALTNLQSTNLDQMNYLELNDIQKNFRELLINHPSVGYSFMYTFEPQNVHTLFSKSNFKPLSYNQISKLPIFDKVIERDGLPLWIGPYEFTELTSNERVFTLVRVVKDIGTLQNKGMLLVQIRTSDLDSIFRYFDYKQENTKYLITNKEGLILYDSTRELENKEFNELMPSFDFSSHSLTERGLFMGEDSAVTTINFGNHEQWKLIAVTPYNVISGKIVVISVLIGSSIGISIICASLFILYVSKRVTSAITDSVKVMMEVEKGNLQARVRVRGNDEIGLLTRGTNRLILRLEQLIAEVREQHERKRIAEIVALQAQIKPHFLFNTLESINILAIQNQGKKVSQMVNRLGNILRISIQQQDKITIEQELAHARSYLEIQKFRFENLFDYHILVDSSLLQETTIKLSLQPLIENCIQHGFEGIEYMGNINVVIKDGGNVIYFRIEDNGVGMSNEQLEILSRLDKSQTTFMNTPEHGERRSIGVRNVADRIRLNYGEPYGIMLCSQLGYGTIIQIMIPKE